MKSRKKMSLYPMLVPSVGIEWLDRRDLDLLDRLSRSGLPEDDGTIESVAAPRVAELKGMGFVILETGAQYSEPVRSLILENWAGAGAGDLLLSMIAACQVQRMPRLSLERGGMVPDFRKPTKIGKVGTGKLSRKEALDLLKSLRECHRHYWPIEQLANIVAPYAKATRLRG